MKDLSEENTPELGSLRYAAPNLLPSFYKWYAVYKELESALREDIAELRKQLCVSEATGKWLDLFGSLLEIDRPTNKEYDGEDSNTNRKEKDEFYRLNILLKASSIYDDFTLTVFNEVSDVFRVSGRLLTNVFENFVQYSFIDLTDKEQEYIAENWETLNNFRLGRASIRVTTGLKDTLFLGGRLGTRFSKVVNEQEDGDTNNGR